jgi:hypothetical protein
MSSKGAHQDDGYSSHSGQLHHHDSMGDRFKHRDRYGKESFRVGRYDRYRDRSRDRRGRSRSPERYQRRRTRSRSPEKGEGVERRRNFGRPPMMIDPIKLPSMDYFMNFKQFLETQPLNIEEEEAVKRYARYKETFQTKHVKTFFDQHRDEEWLKEEYHPAYLKGSREKLLDTIREHYGKFLEDFKKGVYDHVNLDQVAHGVTGMPGQSKLLM